MKSNESRVIKDIVKILESNNKALSIEALSKKMSRSKQSIIRVVNDNKKIFTLYKVDNHVVLKQDYYSCIDDTGDVTIENPEQITQKNLVSDYDQQRSKSVYTTIEEKKIIVNFNNTYNMNIDINGNNGNINIAGGNNNNNNNTAGNTIKDSKIESSKSNNNWLKIIWDFIIKLIRKLIQ